jgi:TolB protein
MTTRLAAAVAAALAVGTTVEAQQDTTGPVEQGVRIGITYTPGVRPGLLVLRADAGPAVDSAQTMLQRDLEYSDHFEIIALPGGERLFATLHRPPPDSGEAANGSAPARFVNYGLYEALGADFAVEVEPADSVSLMVSLYDVRGAAVRRRLPVPTTDVASRAFRMAVHRIADEIVRAVTGEPGYAASSLVFVSNRRAYRVDADGAGLTAISQPGDTAFSVDWGPEGRRVAYTALHAQGGRVVLHDFARGSYEPIEPTLRSLNYTPTFSPDGELVAFARSDAEGTDIYRYNVRQDCCLERLTVGRFSDNLSPTFSPDGRQIAYVSTRAGLPQIYVMAADGTDQELFAPFDYGVTGASYAPEWSPDGTRLVFHRDVSGSPQVFIMETRSRVVKQLTSAGRNEDPTWAPDGRHIAFVSSRTGTRQLWVIDVETGRIRQLTRIGSTRLPSWSPRLLELER